MPFSLWNILSRVFRSLSGTNACHLVLYSMGYKIFVFCFVWDVNFIFVIFQLQVSSLLIFYISPVKDFVCTLSSSYLREEVLCFHKCKVPLNFTTVFLYA